MPQEITVATITIPHSAFEITLLKIHENTIITKVIDSGIIGCIRIISATKVTEYSICTTMVINVGLIFIIFTYMKSSQKTTI
ncbi:MAG: hypothetical protein FWG70_09320 [Oscillospiraceae bacterium]|nr:hypothetical protein [Oscillospiraceae bacterium]